MRGVSWFGKPRFGWGDPNMSGGNNTPGTITAEERRVTLASPHVARHLRYALELAAYAIESGTKTANGDALPFADIATIQTTAAKLGALDGRQQGASPAAQGITTGEWNDFEQAHYRLATLLNPVTGETLQNTKGTSRRQAQETDEGQIPASGPLYTITRNISGFLI